MSEQNVMTRLRRHAEQEIRWGPADLEADPRLDQARRRADVLAAELGLAGRIQRGLLPGGVPRPAGFDLGAVLAPARYLAGDFFDFRSLSGERLLVVLGDVAGKGAPAALYGSLALGLIRGRVAGRNPAPAVLLSQLNRHLLDVRTTNRFLALTVGVLDPGARELVLAVAGLPRPRLVRDGRVLNVDAKGLPLGLFRDVVYHEVRLSLEPGDALLLCTDGVEDAYFDADPGRCRADLDAHVGGLSRLPAQAMAEALARPAAGHAGRAASDDRTVVVIRAS